MSDSVVSIDALARRCFEREARTAERELNAEIAESRNPADVKVIGGCMVPLVVLAAVIAGNAGGPAWFLGIVGLVTLIFAVGAREKKAPIRAKRSAIRKAREDGIAAYGRGEPWAVLRVHEFAVDEFRDRIQTHRQRTLGTESEWGQARASLAEAADEAERSWAYWRERLRVEPGNKLARAQGGVAAKLHVKLDEALQKLDQRADALRKFYNDCDARIAVMAGRNRDLEESRRLEELSGRADLAVAQAEGVIHSIAIAFVADAENMAEALGVVSTFGVKSLAGDAPIEDIEYYADRIIEDSDRERATIEDLDRRLTQGVR